MQLAQTLTALDTLTDRTPAPVTASRKRLWTGRIISGVAVLFLVVDTLFKVTLSSAAVEGTTQLGYPAGSILTIGLIEAACLIAYLVPRTAILGAVLCLDNPLFTHQLFPIYVAALLWGGLYLRDRRVRALIGGR
jgi:hypothetical protein